MWERGGFLATILELLRRPCRPRHLYAVPRTSLQCVCTRRRNRIAQLSPSREYALRTVDFPARNSATIELTHYPHGSSSRRRITLVNSSPENSVCANVFRVTQLTSLDAGGMSQTCQSATSPGWLSEHSVSRRETTARRTLRCRGSAVGVAGDPSEPTGPRGHRRSPARECRKPLWRPSQPTRGGRIRRLNRSVWSGFRRDMSGGAWQQRSLRVLG